MSDFGSFEMEWSSDPHLKRVFDILPLRSLHILLKLHELIGDLLLPLFFPYFLDNLQLNGILHIGCILIDQFFSFYVS